MPPKVIDWTAIKNEYLTTASTHADLAKKYGITRDAVARKAAKEKWTEQREKVRLESAEKSLLEAQKSVHAQQAENIRKANEEANEVAHSLLRMVANMIANPPEGGWQGRDASELSKALNNSLNIIRDTNGYLSQNDISRIQQMQAQTKVLLEEHEQKIAEARDANKDNVTVEYEDTKLEDYSV